MNDIMGRAGQLARPSIQPIAAKRMKKLAPHPGARFNDAYLAHIYDKAVAREAQRNRKPPQESYWPGKVVQRPDYVPRSRPVVNIIRPGQFILSEEERNPLPPIPFGGPWEVLPYWAGETAFVIASGPTIAEVDFEKLRGRKIIATNSSVELVPFADFLFFGDGRWWDWHKKTLVGFPGHVVTVSGMVLSKRVLRLRRIKPDGPATGFSADPKALASQRTSLQGSMNLAALLGVANIALVGADMTRAPDGRSHGHKPHRSQNRPGNITWDEQMRVLKWIVKPLAVRGIRVFNLSPGEPVSRIPWWPKMSIDEFLAKEEELCRRP